MGKPEIGTTRDYRLKNEDNNALHAAFARNHLGAGLGTTRAPDAYAIPGNGRVTFYVHHSPGCGQVRAGARVPINETSVSTTRTDSILRLQTDCDIGV